MVIYVNNKKYQTLGYDEAVQQGLSNKSGK